MNNNYLELLKDPRWQKKRLEILSRDKWTCVECGSKEKSLQVDHKAYAPSGLPWDVDDGDLQTLCEDCHGEVTLLRREVRRVVGRVCIADLRTLAGYASFMVPIEDLDRPIVDLWALLGLANAVGLPPVMLAEFPRNGITITARNLMQASNDFEIAFRRRTPLSTANCAGDLAG